MKKLLLHFVLIMLAIYTSIVPLHAQKQANARSQWFVDSRFGMFIHWGIYSGAEGLWKGEKLRYNNNYAEWIYYRNSIDRDEYVHLLDRFDWDKINPEQWVLTAKQAGMKYIIFTAKHHDGFALWNSQASDYNVSHYTKDHRDIVQELAKACRKHGIKLGLYYSHWIDWEHPMGWRHDKEIYPITPKQYDTYWQQKVMPQIKELLSNYGDISMLWFDMWIHHSKSIITKEQLLQLKQLIRQLQPNCLINSRLGLNLDEDKDIDFKTLNDNELGQTKEDFPWQSPATVAHSWGFSAYEEQWKSTTTLLHNLIGNVSLNGNMVLNVGPRANGDVPYEITDRLQKIGAWLHTHDEAIYHTQAFDLDKDLNDWGRITCKRLPNGNTRLYLHLYNYPIDAKLLFSGVLDRPQKVYMLSDSTQTPLQFRHTEVLTQIELPKESPDPYVPVVVVEYDTYPNSKNDFVAINAQGGYQLNPNNALSATPTCSITPPQKFGSIPTHIRVDSLQTLIWQIYIDQPCTLHADASYYYAGNKPEGIICVVSAQDSIAQALQVGRLTVGEPNMDWHVKCFESHKIGTLSFPKKGLYTIHLQIEAIKTLDFQWLWLE